MNTSDQMLNDLQFATGMSGLFSMFVSILSIILVWFVLQEFKLEVFFKFPRSRKARMFQVILSVILGHLFASFILDYLSWTTMLKSFVE